LTPLDGEDLEPVVSHAQRALRDEYGYHPANVRIGSHRGRGSHDRAADRHGDVGRLAGGRADQPPADLDRHRTGAIGQRATAVWCIDGRGPIPPRRDVNLRLVGVLRLNRFFGVKSL
jgi:hypothetical protein